MCRRDKTYQFIDNEIEYGIEHWGGEIDNEKSISEWLNYIECHIGTAKNKIYLGDKTNALHELRKIAALSIRALEIHGCPERNNFTAKKHCKCCNCKCDNNE